MLRICHENVTILSHELLGTNHKQPLATATMASSESAPNAPKKRHVGLIEALSAGELPARPTGAAWVAVAETCAGPHEVGVLAGLITLQLAEAKGRSTLPHQGR